MSENPISEIGVIKPLRYDPGHVTVPNEFAQDRTLSSNAKDFILDTVSRSPGWRTSAKGMMSTFGWYLNKSRKVLTEGVRAGYIYERKIRCPKTKRYLGTAYIVCAWKKQLRAHVVEQGWEGLEYLNTEPATQNCVRGSEGEPATQKPVPGNRVPIKKEKRGRKQNSESIEDQNPTIDSESLATSPAQAREKGVGKKGREPRAKAKSNLDFEGTGKMNSVPISPLNAGAPAHVSDRAIVLSSVQALAGQHASQFHAVASRWGLKVDKDPRNSVTQEKAAQALSLQVQMHAHEDPELLSQCLQEVLVSMAITAESGEGMTQRGWGACAKYFGAALKRKLADEKERAVARAIRIDAERAVQAAKVGGEQARQNSRTKGVDTREASWTQKASASARDGQIPEDLQEFWADALQYFHPQSDLRKAVPVWLALSDEEREGMGYWTDLLREAAIAAATARQRSDHGGTATSRQKLDSQRIFQPRVEVWLDSGEWKAGRDAFEIAAWKAQNSLTDLDVSFHASRLWRWVDSSGMGWEKDWGPLPGQPGCLIPEQVFRRHAGHENPEGWRQILQLIEKTGGTNPLELVAA